MSETIEGQCTTHRRWMLRSKLRHVYFPNTIAKVFNSTVKSNTLRVRACFAGAQLFFSRRGGGAFSMSRPRGPWFLNPSMHTHTNTHKSAHTHSLSFTHTHTVVNSLYHPSCFLELNPSEDCFGLSHFS